MKAQIIFVVILPCILVSVFAANPPFTIDWPDRRPIGMEVLGNRGFISTNNPRGYINYGKSYLSLSGIARFRTDLLARATTEVSILLNLHAQGIIVWDLEGQETSFSYLGDPRNLGLESPEMNAAVDDFFTVFTSAGLRVGILARRQAFGVGTNLPANPKIGQVFYMPYPYGAFQRSEYVCYTNGSWFQTNAGLQQQTTNFYSDFVAKIEYAKNRWGATLFYLDSFSSYAPDRMAALSNIVVLYPDILLAPEAGGGVSNTNTTTALQYFSVCAPFLDPTYSGYLVPGSVTSTYPSAFALIKINNPYTNVAAIANSITNGNIMLIQSYNINPGNIAVSNAMKVIVKPSPPNTLRAFP